MKKMKTLFKRVFDDRHNIPILNEVEEGCEWVLNGEGKATRKYDGTCCLILNNYIYKRFDYKQGRVLPEGAIPCQDVADEITGHFPHWVKCKENEPSDKWHIKAFVKLDSPQNGTYELCGVHFQKNIDGVTDAGDILIKHGEDILEVERTFEGIEKFLQENEVEGIVFYRGNGEMCKIKRSDFGFKWGNSKRR